MKQYVLSIDSSRGDGSVALVDCHGAIVRRWAVSDLSGEPAGIAETITAALGQCKDTDGSILAVGVAVPDDLNGQVCAAENTVLNQTGVGTEGGIPVGGRSGAELSASPSVLSGPLGIPVISNRAFHCACWAEYSLGAGRAFDDMVMLHLSDPMAGAMILHGCLLDDLWTMPYGPGHSVIDPAGAVCSCGQTGCLCCYASPGGMVGQVHDALERGTASTLADGSADLCCAHVFEHARCGDALANAVIDRAAAMLATFCVNILHLVEPHGVVMSMDGPMDGAMLLDRVRQCYDATIWTLKPEPLSMVLAQLSDDAVVIGASQLARKSLGCVVVSE